MALENIAIDGSLLDDLALDFTLPGYDFELIPGGRDTGVTIHNLDEYIGLVIDWTMNKGVAPPGAALSEWLFRGLSSSRSAVFHSRGTLETIRRRR